MGDTSNSIGVASVPLFIVRVIVEMINSRRLTAQVHVAPQICWDGKVKKVSVGRSQLISAFQAVENAVYS